jgi:Ca2+-dependent lipid-binding protein
VHDNTLVEKKRVATLKNIVFKETVQKNPVELLTLKMELLEEFRATQQKLKIIESKMKQFKVDASVYWEAGSKELEF